MTPLAMQMLIWWHVHPHTAKFPGAKHPAQQELISSFMNDCMIWRVAPDEYSLTPIGVEWLERALATPLRGSWREE
jgi:hypothetical protein